MDLFDVIDQRRSVRVFTSTSVPEHDLRRILDAARKAPSSGNQQPWQFLVLRDRAVIDRLRDAALEQTMDLVREKLPLSPDEMAVRRTAINTYLTGFLSAPVAVVILADREAAYPDYLVHDGPLAAAHLMLAARALGYGTVYGTDAVPEPAIREVLRIPERYALTCIIPLGVPESWPEGPAKKPLDEMIVWDGFSD